MLTIGSLFSGIGGLELGLEWAGLGPVVWQCEIDPFCRKVLEKNWPGVERFEDVRELTNPPSVDLICGGFPCQDVSSAGKGAGLAGSRSGLWYEFSRIIETSRPSWVVVENVASGTKRWVDEVCNQLVELDYEALPVPLSAESVGAPHKRERVFIVAYSNSEPVREQQGWSSRPGRGNQILAGADGYDGNHDSQGESAEQEHVKMARMRRTAANTPSWATAPSFCRVDDGLSSAVVRRSSTAAIRRAPERRNRLRALGNAVVPQCAEVIGWIIRELLEEQNGRSR